MDLTHLSSQLKLKTNFNAGQSLGLRNINSITGVVDNSITSLQALIFRNDDPKYDDIDTSNFDVTGITSGYDNKAFVFDLKKEYKMTLSSDITDHYVEDNVAIQDHIGLKPIILDVVGCISEINLIDTKSDIKKESENGIFNSLDSYLNRMGSLTSFAPNIVNQALDIYNSAKFAYATVNKLINTGKNSSGSGLDYTEAYNEDVIKQTKQFEWISWFKTQWEKRASFSIVTPYEVLTDMYIMELSASQPENTRYVTNLTIRFKQIRKAVIVDSPNKVGRTKDIQDTKTTEIKVDMKDIDTAARQYGDTASQGIINNNANVPVKGDKYTVASSNNTSKVSYNVNPGENQVSDTSAAINSEGLFCGTATKEEK